MTESLTASPRNDAEPMGFTGAEFGRGVVAAWLWAMGLPSLVWTVAFPPVGVVGVVFIVPFATLTTIALAGPAYLLGRAMITLARTSVHAVAFAVLGLFAGVGATLAYFLWADASPALDTSGHVYLVNALCGAAAVVLGWRHAVRRALGAGPSQQRRAAPSAVDEATEDELADRARLR